MGQATTPNTFSPDDVEPWQRLDPPVWWPRLGDYVIADRHLPDGTRQHMARGHAPHGLVVGNAQVIGEAGEAEPTLPARNLPT